MPLFALPTRPSIAPNVSAPVAWGPSDLVIAAGTTLYSQGINMIFREVFNYPYPAITNHGTIWADGTSFATAINVLFGYSGPISNDGLIVAWTTAGPAYALEAGTWLGNSINNSGQIYAISDDGNATAVVDWNFAPLTNSGLIAALAPRGSAQAVFFEYGQPLLNTASGSILAEGAEAIAVTLVSARPQPGFGYTLDNAGLIAAVSTDPKAPSIAIYSDPFGSTDGNVTSIHNSGTIRADIAMYLEWYSADGSITSALDQITNDAGALIEGDIWLGRGGDQILNRGTINGWVGLGEGDDLFDNVGGQLNGALELGYGNDQLTGGSGGERANGDRGDDQMAGGAGDDLLLGGRGNDTIAGDAGNDGLYGDYGDDLIRTSGGDIAYGGGDQDRIEAGDYAFALIDGGTGFDWLALPTGPRTLDLSAVLASNRLREIEGIALGGGKHLTVRSADVTSLTGGETQLLVAGDGSDTVELVGAWVAGASSVIDGVTYRAYALDGTTVQVASGLTVQVTASATGASGLDAIAGGTAAPIVEGAGDLLLSTSSTTGQFVDVSEFLQIDPDETWTINNTVYSGTSSRLELFTGDQLVNYGQITSTANGTTATFNSLINYGHILAQDGPESANTAVVGPLEITNLYNWFFMLERGAIGANGGLQNFGSIDVHTGNSGGAGIVESSFANHGTMTVTSTELLAVGFQFDFGGSATNTGQISATGYRLAAGALTHQAASSIINSGSISASTTGPDGTAVGLLYSWVGGFGINTVTNSGSITAPTAIMSHNGDQGVWVTNTGSINGSILFDTIVSTAIGLVGHGGADRVINQGSINGEVRLGVGYDRYTGTGGHQTGV